MRPQGFGQMGSGLEDLGWNDMGFEPPRPALASVPAGEDLPAPRSNPALGLSPVSPVHVVQEEIVQRLATEAVEEVFECEEPVVAEAPSVEDTVAEQMEAPVVEQVEAPAPVSQVRAQPAPVAKRPAPAPRSRASVGKAKAAFTLRLDQDRHLKLRLACAVTGTSAQQLVTRALDELLASMPELEAMASRAPERQSVKG
jgi:hypothetical protein